MLCIPADSFTFISSVCPSQSSVPKTQWKTKKTTSLLHHLYTAGATLPMPGWVSTHWEGLWEALHWALPCAPGPLWRLQKEGQLSLAANPAPPPEARMKHKTWICKAASWGFSFFWQEPWKGLPRKIRKGRKFQLKSCTLITELANEASVATEDWGNRCNLRFYPHKNGGNPSANQVEGTLDIFNKISRKHKTHSLML